MFVLFRIARWPSAGKEVIWFFRFYCVTLCSHNSLIRLHSSLRVVGSAMGLRSFQCRGILLLWHMVGQGPAVLAAGAGQVCCFFCCCCFFFCCCCFVLFFISSILSSFSTVSSLGRRLGIPKFCGHGRYNPTVVVSYYRRHAR